MVRIENHLHREEGLTYTELSIATHLNQQLVPQHIRPALASRGLDFESPNFKPLTRDQMLARLD
jgi:glycogen synthase kinase 3 beta